MEALFIILGSVVLITGIGAVVTFRDSRRAKNKYLKEKAKFDLTESFYHD